MNVPNEKLLMDHMKKECIELLLLTLIIYHSYSNRIKYFKPSRNKLQQIVNLTYKKSFIESAGDPRSKILSEKVSLLGSGEKMEQGLWRQRRRCLAELNR